jgi:hypothetical protein
MLTNRNRRLREALGASRTATAGRGARRTGVPHRRGPPAPRSRAPQPRQSAAPPWAPGRRTAAGNSPGRPPAAGGAAAAARGARRALGGARGAGSGRAGVPGRAAAVGRIQTYAGTPIRFQVELLIATAGSYVARRRGTRRPREGGVQAGVLLGEFREPPHQVCGVLWGGRGARGRGGRGRGRRRGRARPGRRPGAGPPRGAAHPPARPCRLRRPQRGWRAYAPQPRPGAAAPRYQHHARAGAGSGPSPSAPARAGEADPTAAPPRYGRGSVRHLFRAA